jgi:hypothetical protein
VMIESICAVYQDIDSFYRCYLYSFNQGARPRPAS